IVERGQQRRASATVGRRSSSSSDTVEKTVAHIAGFRRRRIEGGELQEAEWQAAGHIERRTRRVDQVTAASGDGDRRWARVVDEILVRDERHIVAIASGGGDTVKDEVAAG